MHRKPILVALAGETELRLLAHEGPGHRPREVRHLTAVDFPDVVKTFSSPPGHGHGAGGAGRHGFEKTSEQAVERARFAVHAADSLADAWSGGGYRGIVLAAGPKMLGELRKCLNQTITANIQRELPKDLVGLPLDALADHAELAGQ